MNPAHSFKAVILGATGTTGRDLVHELIRSSNWSTVTVIVRRRLDEWNQLNDSEKAKLNVIITENLENLSDPSKFDLTEHDSFFSCLGSTGKTSKEMAIKVNHEYPALASKLAHHYKIPHFGLISAAGASPKSWVEILKYMGQGEEAVKGSGVPFVSIFKVTWITETRNPRTYEKLLKWIPFVSKSPVRDIVKAMRIDAENQLLSKKDKNFNEWHAKEIDQIARGKLLNNSL